MAADSQTIILPREGKIKARIIIPEQNANKLCKSIW